MEKVAGVDGSGTGASIGEDNADGGEDGNERPGPAKLRSVKKAKEDAGDEDADARTGAGSVVDGCAERAGNASPGRCEERIEVAAENGFFDERRDEYGHGYQKNGAGAIFEKLLNGKVLGRLDHRVDEGDGDREDDAAAKKSKRNPAAGGNIGIDVAEFSPAEGLPERQPLQQAESDIKKQEDKQKQSDVDDHGEAGIRRQLLDELLRIDLAGDGINGQTHLDSQHNAENKNDEQTEVKPGSPKRPGGPAYREWVNRTRRHGRLGKGRRGHG